MTAKLMASLRAAPVTVPQLAALALFVLWATEQAGYPVTHWAPGGIVVLLLLGLALLAVRPRGLPASLRVALAAFAAYTAFSYLSILWASGAGDAWEGANRTLLYLLVFALFACWRQDAVSAALLLAIWILSMVGLADRAERAPARVALTVARTPGVGLLVEACKCGGVRHGGDYRAPR
jgi:hypothetical protein